MSKYYGFIELEHETLLENIDKYLKENEVFLHSGTFEALHDRMCKENEIIQSFYKQARDLYKAKVDSKKYNDEYLKQTYKDLHKEVEDYAELRKEEVQKVVSFTINEARERIMKALNNQPTSDQSIFLNVIKNNNHITREEALGMLSKFADNYMSVRTFQSILEEKGLYLHLPKAYDYNEMLKALSYAEHYISRVMFDFGNERKDFKTAEAKDFLFVLDDTHKDLYKHDNKFYKPVIEVIDKNILTAPKCDIKDISNLNKEEKQIFYEIINAKDIDTIIEKINKLTSDKVANVLKQIPEYQVYLEGEGNSTQDIKNTQKDINKIIKNLENKQKEEDSIETLRNNMNS